MQAARETKHHVFSNFLNRAREIHVALSQQSFGFAGRAAEQLVELAVRHRKTGCNN